MNVSIIPSPLQKGNTVCLVSTARKIQPEELTQAKATLESWGLNVVYGEHLFATHHQFAGTDALRAADLQAAINNPNVDAILCARGGYGSVRIVDLVDFSPLLEHPKLLAGYSDVTTLHNRLHAMGLASLHSTMPISFPTNTAAAIQSLKDAFFGNALQYSAPAHALNRKGEATAQVVGGNLSILYSLTGTNDDLNTAGKLLFLEDLDEYLYHIDRMMQNLKKAEKLKNLAGLIVGGMTDMNDNVVSYGKTAEEIIVEAVADYNYPVCFGFPCGHWADNRTLKLGVDAHLEVSTSGASFYQKKQ